MLEMVTVVGSVAGLDMVASDVGAVRVSIHRGTDGGAAVVADLLPGTTLPPLADPYGPTSYVGVTRWPVDDQGLYGGALPWSDGAIYAVDVPGDGVRFLACGSGPGMVAAGVSVNFRDLTAPAELVTPSTTLETTLDAMVVAAVEAYLTAYPPAVQALTPSTVPGLLDYDASTPDEPVPVVLLSDTFDRTSSSLPGSTANTGQTWAGTANAWTADGSHAIGSATGSLCASAGVGDQTLTANLSLITTGTGTAQTVRVYMRSPGGAGDGLWLAFAISNTGAWGVSVWKTIGGASTQLGSVPATTVANGSATAQAVTVTATLDGTTFTVTVTPPAGSPQTFTATIPLAEVNALTGGDVALLTLGGAAPGIRFDALTVTRPGDPLPETGGRIVTAAADGALPPLVLDALDTRYGGGSGGSVGVGALEKLRNLKGFGAGSATIAVVSDSTANDDGDWVRVWMRKWGATLPSRVQQTYSSWNEATPGWRTQVVDAAGVAPDTGVIVDDDFTRTGDVVGSTPTSGPAWTGTAGEFIADGSKVVITPTPGAFLKTAMGVRDMTLTADMIVTTTAPAAPVSMRVYISDVIWALLELQTTGFLRVGLYKTIAGVTTLIGAFKTVAGVVANSPTPQTVSITMQTAIQDITFTATAAGSTTTVTGTITESDYAALGTSAMFYVGYVSDPTYPIALDRARIKTPAADAPVAPPHLDVWNAAVAGARLSTFDATRRAAAFGGKHLDVLILSVGHNDQITTGPDFVAQVESWLDEWTSEHPGCAVVVVSQNPQVSPAAGIVAHRDRQAALRLWAKGRGYDYVPAFEAFTAEPDGGASLISPDGVHPTVPPSGLTGSYGSVLWADTALAALEG